MAINEAELKHKLLHFLDPVECFSVEPKKQDQILPGLVSKTVGGLTAPGGVGKSQFAIQAGLSVAAGKDLFGIGASGEGKVLYLAGEDPDEELHRRLHALTNYIPSSNHAAIKRNFILKPCASIGLSLAESSHIEILKKLEQGCRLIILDTLSNFHSLDENSSADANRLMNAMRDLAEATGAAVIYVHHVNKSSVLNAQTGNPHAARGSSALSDNSKWMASVAVMTESEAKTLKVKGADREDYVRFIVSKKNYSGKLEDRWFKRDKKGVLLPVDLQLKPVQTEAQPVGTGDGRKRI